MTSPSSAPCRPSCRPPERLPADASAPSFSPPSRSLVSELASGLVDWRAAACALATAFALLLGAVAVEAAKPTLAFAELNGTELILYFDDRLKASAVPSRSDFSYRRGSGGAQQPAGNPSVTGNVVTIPLTNPLTPIRHGETVRFSYTPNSNAANRIQDRSGNQADAIAQWADIDNRTPPEFSSASVNRATLVLTFDGGLEEDRELVPQGSAFTVKRTRSGTQTTVSLLATNPVAVSGTQVTLSLAEAVVRTDTVTVAYTDPGTGGRLRDDDNWELPVPSFQARSVTNNTPAPAGPEFSRAAVNGNTLTVTFDLPLQTTPPHTPPRSAFAVTAKPPYGTARTISGSTGNVAISGSTVTVPLADEVERGESVTVRYAIPTTNKLRGTNTLFVNPFSGGPVTNNSPGSPAPTFSGASYSYPRGGITVEFTGPFLGCADRYAWSIKVDGGERYPQSVRCEDRAVLLVLAALTTRPAVEAARSVTVSYSRGRAAAAERSTPLFHPPRGSPGPSTRLRGTDGSVVASFTDQTVTGLKPRLVPPPTVDGSTLTLTFDRPLDPASRPLRRAFDVTVNGAQRHVAGGGVAVAGKTVTLTLASAVAAGEAVTVRYTNFSNTRTSNRTLKGVNGLMVDTFEYQTADNPRVIWSATLTVAEVMSGGNTYHGCFPGIEDKTCRDQLTQSSFMSGGTSYEVRSFSRNHSQTSLNFQLDRATPRDWTLHVDGHRFPVAKVVFAPGSTVAKWSNVNFDWTDGQQVSVCLTIGSSDSGSANPCPSSSSTESDAEGDTSALIAGDPPWVTDVSVASGAGADKTYGLGDTIRVQVDFVEAVEVTGTPRLKIDMDPAHWGEKWAAYESGSGTRTLIFAHTVVEPNYSTQGIAVLANSLALNGGTIRAGGADANLAHDGLDHDANHKVNWQTASDGGVSGTDVDDPLCDDCQAPVVVEDDANADSGPPTVTGVQVISDPGDDDTYMLGETIRIRASFSEAVAVTGSPRLSIDMDPAAWGTKQAAYASGGGTSSLTFVHTVAEPNFSSQGIAVLANSLALNGGTIRSSAAANANAALAHTGLGHDSGHKVDWRPSVSVADARANEAAGAKVAFQVSLSRAFTNAAHRVTVDYATADGTAKAGADYTATSGTLTFAAGETSKTVNVPIIDDSHDEGEETFTLRLSNATGARIGDGEATGTIVNTDPIPKAWLARFGRTVADHVVDAVTVRLSEPRAAGVEATLAGHALPSWSPGGGTVPGAVNGTTGEALYADADTATLLRRWMAGTGPEDGPGPGFGMFGDDSGPGIETRALTERDVRAGTSFALTTRTGGASFAALWGRGAISGFDGRESGLTLDGQVTTGMIGADWSPEPGSGRWTAGLVLGRSSGSGSYRVGSCTTQDAGDIQGGCGGTVAATLGGLYPWAGAVLGERLSVWAAAGVASGRVTVTPDGSPALTAGLGMSMGAAGLRSEVLKPSGGDGFALAFETDARVTATRSDATQGLVASRARVWQVRAGIEGSRPFALGGGARATPSFEIGLRLDGGDAERGTGADMGGGLAFSDPANGISFSMLARGLVVHKVSGFREWGASMAFAWDPKPETDRGLSLSLTRSWGASPSGGMDALFARETMAGLSANDNGFGDTGDAGQLSGEISYGLGVFGDRFTGTANLGVGIPDGGGRDVRVGWHLSPEANAGLDIDASLDVTRREPANGNEPPRHGIALTGTIRW